MEDDLTRFQRVGVTDYGTSGAAKELFPYSRSEFAFTRLLLSGVANISGDAQQVLNNMNITRGGVYHEDNVDSDDDVKFDVYNKTQGGFVCSGFTITSGATAGSAHLISGTDIVSGAVNEGDLLSLDFRTLPSGYISGFQLKLAGTYQHVSGSGT